MNVSPVFLLAVLLGVLCSVQNASSSEVDTNGVAVQVLNELNNAVKHFDGFLHTPAGEELLSDVLPPLWRLIEDVDELGHELRATIKELISELIPELSVLVKLAQEENWNEVVEVLKRTFNTAIFINFEKVVVKNLQAKDSTAAMKVLTDLADINSALEHFSESGGLAELYATLQPSVSALLDKIDILGIGLQDLMAEIITNLSGRSTLVDLYKSFPLKLMQEANKNII